MVGIPYAFSNVLITTHMIKNAWLFIKKCVRVFRSRICHPCSFDPAYSNFAFSAPRFSLSSENNVTVHSAV